MRTSLQETKSISLLGSLYKVVTDKEGESTISFKVPLSDLKRVADLQTTCIEKLLRIKIAEESLSKEETI